MCQIHSFLLSYGNAKCKKPKEDPGNYRPVSLNSIPGNMMEQLILDVIYTKGRKKRLLGVVSRDSPRGNHA